MDSDTPLDHALFQLSPRRSRCELFVSGGGKTDKIASGFLKPFVSHLKVAEEQAMQSPPSIKLEVEPRQNAGTWFNKGTLERFVRFVSTPDVLELVNTFDAEMSKLEGARGLYSQGTGDQHSVGLGENETTTSATVDITKRGVLRAIDSRLVAVKQDLTMACARASAAGFTLNNVSDLHLFAEHFSAHRLSEACTKFISLCQRRPELTGGRWRRFEDDGDAPSSSGSDMSIDDPNEGPTSPVNPAGSGPHRPTPLSGQVDPVRPHDTCRHPKPVQQRAAVSVEKPAESGEGTRRPSVLDRINLFESKQKEESTNAINIIAGAGGGNNKPTKPELRRLHSDVSANKSVLRRWSGEGAVLTPSGDSGARLKDPSDSQTKEEGISLESKILTTQSQWRTSPAEFEINTRRKEPSFSQGQVGPYQVEAEVEENRDLQGMKLHRQASAPTQIKKLQDRQHERIPAQFGGPPFFYKGNGEMFDPGSTSSVEQIQTVRPSRGNQQLNDELRMKADELEELFAAHKRRVYGDQMDSSRRSRPEGLPVDRVPKSVEKRPAEVPPESFPGGKEGSSNDAEFDGNLLLKMVDNQDYVYNMMQNLGNLNKPDDYKGKSYGRYMQKRDAKLREEWGSKSAQKEAKMKALQDSIEESQAEMEAQFTRSAERQDLPLHARRRSERLRSLRAHSAIEIKEQTLESLQSEEEGDLQKMSEQIHYGRDKPYNDALLSDSSSTSFSSNKLLSSRSVSSSTARTSMAPIPRLSVNGSNTSWQQPIESFQREEEEEDRQQSSEQVQCQRNKSCNGTVFCDGSSKSINSKKLLSSRSVSSSTAPKTRPTVRTTSSGPIRRRNQSSNLSAQSGYNFVDFRKENTKPSNGTSKVTIGAQPRNFARSKSTSEGLDCFKEEKPGGSQSQRKSSANTREMNEQTVFNKNQSGESKPFLRKGNGIGPGSGVGIAKRKPSIASEILKNREESEASVDRRHDSPDMVNVEHVDFGRTLARGRADDFPAESDCDAPMSSQGSGNSGDPCSENGSVLVSPPRADIYRAAISSNFDSYPANVQDSPGESPGSWNSHIHNSFSYAHESSNIEASVDSPTSSPASWNTHPLNQLREADSARIRKKWGRVQKPFVVPNDSHQSSKDVTKGFKRLLRFGRKSKGAESIATDSVSVSTASEVDYIEDGHDQANWSVEDPRMSRMGYQLPAYNGFNVDEIFTEEVQSSTSSIPTSPAKFKPRQDHLSGSSLKSPRSFFSLPSFRRRGSESRLR